MKSFSFAKALTLGCLVCLTLPVACGDDDDSGTTKPGTGGEPNAGAPSTDAGAGGAAAAPIAVPGTSDMTKTIKCGDDMCTSVKTIIPGPVFVDPCCAGTACGVDAQFFAVLGAPFAASCQAVGQVGDADDACPASPDQMVAVPGSPAPFAVPGFAGCCRAETGTCGVVVDSIPVTGIPLPFATPKLGCVDSAPFFKNKAGAACGGGTAGNGSGGAAPDAGGAASGGASVGGAGGNP
jgi:hypothetical protein